MGLTRQADKYELFKGVGEISKIWRLVGTVKKPMDRPGLLPNLLEILERLSRQVSVGVARA